MFEQSISLTTALGAGLLSFFSPCILPLLPAYFSFITGVSLEELLDSKKDFSIRKKVILSTILFIMGFTSVFVLMGFSATAAGGFLLKFSNYLRIAGGIVVIILGVHLTGFIKIKFLELEKRFNLKKRPVHFAGAFFAGNAFAAGWTPCIGPILGSILVLASSQQTMSQGGILLLTYSAGLAIPFFILSLVIHMLIGFMQKTKKILKYMNLIAGIFLIFIGIVLVTDKFSLFTNIFM